MDKLTEQVAAKHREDLEKVESFKGLVTEMETLVVEFNGEGLAGAKLKSALLQAVGAMDLPWRASVEPACKNLTQLLDQHDAINAAIAGRDEDQANDV